MLAGPNLHIGAPIVLDYLEKAPIALGAKGLRLDTLRLHGGIVDKKRLRHA